MAELLIAPFALVVVALPALAWGSRMHPHAIVAPAAIALQSIMVQGIVGITALVAMFGAGLTFNWKPVGILPSSLAMAAAGVAGFLAVSVLQARMRRSTQRSPLPDLGKWYRWPSLSVIVVASIVEEFAYRGVLTSLLANHLPLSAAAGASALVFAASHIRQGWVGFWAAGAFAIFMQLLVFTSGGLALAVAAHAAYDLGAAILAGRIRKTDIETAL